MLYILHFSRFEVNQIFDLQSTNSVQEKIVKNLKQQISPDTYLKYALRMRYDSHVFVRIDLTHLKRAGLSSKAF